MPFFTEAGRVGEVCIGQNGRGALQRTFLVGVSAAFGQFYVGIHIAEVSAQTQVFYQLFAEFHFYAGSHSVVRIPEAVQGSSALQCLDTFYRAVEVFEVTSQRNHVSVFAEAFVTQVEVVVVAVLQLVITADLCRTVGFLIEEGSHFDE